MGEYSGRGRRTSTGRTSVPAARRQLTPDERKRLLKKRIKELRRRKRLERKREMYRRRLLAASIATAAFVVLFLSAVTVLATRGGDTAFQDRELAASNLEALQGLQAQADMIRVPDISAGAAFLLDTSTGDVLFEKNADLQMPMASTTKIMTAILTLENASPEERVVISERASSTGESSAWLERGEELTVDQLLHALMVQSANDAAVALAEHVAGSVEDFVVLMNRKAEELGAQHTRFANPHGLDQPGHYTTARDLAAIAAYAMRNTAFREIVTSDDYEIPWPGHPFPRVMDNHNKFLRMYPGATGVKTGYTLGAGKCLVASAEREGRELISVILNGDDTYWDQTARLMDYGFESFARVEFARAGQQLAEVYVGDFPRRTVNAVTTRDLAFTVRRDRLQDFLAARISSPRWMPYPVSRGQEIAFLELGGEGYPQRIEPLVAEGDCRPPGFLARFFCFLWAVLCQVGRWVKWLVPGI